MNRVRKVRIYRNNMTFPNVEKKIEEFRTFNK